MSEFDMYERIKNWDFSMIDCSSLYLTDWDLYRTLKEMTNSNSVILDLGTGGGERVINDMPVVKEILATDYSPSMIECANKNLERSGRNDIHFRVMDNLKMDVPNDYFDFVVARNTVTDKKMIYKALKKGGMILIRGVDKLDCWDLKMVFGCGQGYDNKKAISQIDFEEVIKAGFNDVELIPIYAREYYKTKDDLMKLLLKAPIISSNGKIDERKLDLYIDKHSSIQGIVLHRIYYGIIGRK